MVTLDLRVFEYNVYLCFPFYDFSYYCFVLVVDENGGVFASLLKTFTQNLNFA